jgi:hypothetical protein
LTASTSAHRIPSDADAESASQVPLDANDGVHLSGLLRAVDSPDALLAVLARLEGP